MRLLILTPTAAIGLTYLSAAPAWAVGGGSANGATGGADSAEGAGTAGAAGTFNASGSGGGAGATGGAGGDGGVSPTPGGAGGATAGANGQAGTTGASPGGGSPRSGAGGGGGAHGGVAATLPVAISKGGTGGAGGGSGPSSVAPGGGGGAGGWGAVVTGTGDLGSLSTTVTGGNGGAGGAGISRGGGGGSGGQGLVFVTSGAAAVIGAAVTGGNGAAGGAGFATGAVGAGGAGIVGSDLNLTLNATVTGGLSGTGIFGSTRANAITFGGGANTLALGAGWGLVGNIAITGSLAISPVADATLSNVITGTGSLQVTGSKTLILTGASTYSGGTTINSGATLQIGSGGTTGSIVGAVTSNGTLTFNRSDAVSFAGDISGSGGVTQAGTGTTTLTGGLTYTGPTNVNAGTLVLGNAGILTAGTAVMNVAVGATLDLASLPAATLAMNSLNGGGSVVTRTLAGQTLSVGGDGAFSGVISGGAGLLVASGTTILSGANTYTGGTTISGGTLQIGSGGTTGSILNGVVNNGTLAFNRSDDVTFGNAISGTGGVTQAGTGTTTLTSTNTYGGGTAVNAGTLRITGVGSIGTGGLSVASGGTFDASGITAAGLSLPTLNGAGGVVLGAKGLTITSGGSFSGGISGTGSFSVTGGTMTLAGTNSYAGATQVSGGSLIVNGSIASSSGLTVGQGGLVGGTGALPSTVMIGQGGTLSPGNSVGTINVAGNLTLASGSTLAVEVQGATADRVNVTGAAVLNGNVRLLPLGGSYTFNAPYTLVSAASVTGTPIVSTTGSFGAGVTAGLSQTATQLQLVLTPAQLVTPPNGGTSTPGGGGTTPTPVATAPGLVGFLPGNIVRTASALDAARAAGGNLQPFFNVYNAPANQIGNAVNQLSGEVGTTMTGMGLIAGQQFLSSMLNPFSFGRDTLLGRRIAANGSADGDDLVPGALRPRYAMWGQATGGYSQVSGESSSGSTTRTARGAGFAMGLDVALGTASMVGVAAGAGETSASLSGGLGRANAWSGQLGVFGRTRQATSIGGFTLEGAAAVTFLQTDTKRTQYFLNNAEQRASYDARVYSFRLEARHDGLRRWGASFQPFLAIQAQVVDSDGYSERSAAPGTSTGITAQSSTNSTVRSELGMQAEGSTVVSGRQVRGFARVAWGHYMMREQSSAVALQAFPGNGFTVQGARPDTDSAILAAGIETEIAPRWTLGARIDSELSSRVREVAGTVRLRYSF